MSNVSKIKREAMKIRQKTGKYILIEGEQYRMSFGGLHFKCFHPAQATDHWQVVCLWDPSL